MLPKITLYTGTSGKSGCCLLGGGYSTPQTPELLRLKSIQTLCLGFQHFVDWHMDLTKIWGMLSRPFL